MIALYHMNIVKLNDLTMDKYIYFAVALQGKFSLVLYIFSHNNYITNWYTSKDPKSITDGVWIKPEDLFLSNFILLITLFIF